jgi:phosphate transport system permease protein
VTVILEAPVPKSPEGSGGFVPIKTNTKRSGVDLAYRYTVKCAGFLTFAVLFAIGLFLFIRAFPAFRYMGWHFFTTTQFNTNSTHRMPAKFGVLAALYGSVVIAVVAIVIAVPVSIAAALFVNEYAPRSVLGVFPLKSFLISVVDLMAAVPSIIYGLWGFLVLQPFMANISRFLSVHLSFIPIFRATKGTAVFTGSYLIAGTLVAIMIMPIVTSISREIFSLTPVGEREGALALGATRARVIGNVVLPFAKGGMVGAIMLGLGRALGEAVAVSIILSIIFGTSIQLNSGGISIAALIAARFGSGGTYGISSLLACGFVLFVFTLIINLVASMIVSRSRVG